MRTFSDQELQRRQRAAEQRRGNWNGPYPYRECQNCYDQIHVGGRSICDACLESDKPKAAPDAYLDTVGRMEPDIAHIDASAGWASIAVSLKRIADSLEKIAGASTQAEGKKDNG